MVCKISEGLTNMDDLKPTNIDDLLNVLYGQVEYYNECAQIGQGINSKDTVRMARTIADLLDGGASEQDVRSVLGGMEGAEFMWQHAQNFRRGGQFEGVAQKQAAADVLYECDNCNLEFKDEVEARAHVADNPGCHIAVYSDGQWTGETLAKRTASRDSDSGVTGSNRDKHETCSKCGFFYDKAVDYDSAGRCPECQPAKKKAESGEVTEAAPDMKAVDQSEGEVKEFSRVERASTGEKGIVLKVNDQKPGDIDVLVLWDTPHAGYSIFETDIGDILPLDEQPSEEDIARAKEVRSKYDEDKKKYEESFQKKVKGDEDEKVERDVDERELEQKELQKDLQPATAALQRIGVGPEIPPSYKSGALLDEATVDKFNFELRKHGEEYWVFARMVGRSPFDEDSGKEYDAKKKAEPDDWKNLGSNLSVESQWQKKANLKHWAYDLYTDLLGLDPVYGCFTPIEDEGVQRALARLVLFNQPDIDQRFIELEGPVAERWVQANYVSNGFDYYLKNDRLICWGINSDYNPESIEAEIPDGMWSTIPEYHAQKFMIEAMTKEMEPHYQEIMLRSKARSLLAAAIVKKAKEELEKHDKVDLEKKKALQRTAVTEEERMKEGDEARAREKALAQQPPMKNVPVGEGEKRLLEFIVTLKESHPDLFQKINELWLEYEGIASPGVPAVEPAGSEELQQQMGGGSAVKEQLEGTATASLSDVDEYPNYQSGDKVVMKGSADVLEILGPGRQGTYSFLVKDKSGRVMDVWGESLQPESAAAASDGLALPPAKSIPRIEASFEVEASTNAQVIDMFVNDSFPKDKKPVWGTENLRITKEDNGWSLVNYYTPIMYRANDGTMYFNTDKYSVTTSKIQNYIRAQVGGSAQEVDEAGIRAAIEAHVEAEPAVEPSSGSELEKEIARPENKPVEAKPR